MLQIQMKALLLDTITRIKYNGKGLTTGNINPFRQKFLKANNLPKNYPSIRLLDYIGAWYSENSTWEKFTNTCEKFGLTVTVKDISDENSNSSK